MVHIKRDKNNIFGSGKLPWLGSKQRVQRVGRVCCGGLDGVRSQLANTRWQVLIALLAGSDGTEAPWSALSPHSKKPPEFGSQTHLWGLCRFSSHVRTQVRSSRGDNYVFLVIRVWINQKWSRFVLRLKNVEIIIKNLCLETLQTNWKCSWISNKTMKCPFGVRWLR